MASLRRAMRTTPQAHLFGMALRARGGHGARSDPIHRRAQQEREYAETAAALAERNGIAVRPFDAFASSRSDGLPVAGAFKPRIIRRPGTVAERR